MAGSAEATVGGKGWSGLNCQEFDLRSKDCGSHRGLQRDSVAELTVQRTPSSCWAESGVKVARLGTRRPVRGHQRERERTLAWTTVRAAVVEGGEQLGH